MLLHPAVQNCAAALSERFAAGQPFKHVVIDRFLDEELCRELMDQFPSFDASHAVNEHGEIGRKSAIPDLSRLGAPYGRFDELMREPAFLEMMSGLTGIPKLLYDPEYVGGGTHE